MGVSFHLIKKQLLLIAIDGSCLTMPSQELVNTAETTMVFSENVTCLHIVLEF